MHWIELRFWIVHKNAEDCNKEDMQTMFFIISHAFSYALYYNMDFSMQRLDF